MKKGSRYIQEDPAYIAIIIIIICRYIAKRGPVTVILVRETKIPGDFGPPDQHPQESALVIMAGLGIVVRAHVLN